MPGRTASERGNATGLTAAGLLLLTGLVAAGLVGLLWQITLHRVQGAADLVALTGARARQLGTSEPCAAASRAASSLDVTLVSCRSDGSGVEFVVTVRVRGGSGRVMIGVPLQADADAHAGVLAAGP